MRLSFHGDQKRGVEDDTLSSMAAPLIGRGDQRKAKYSEVAGARARFMEEMGLE